MDASTLLLARQRNRAAGVLLTGVAAATTGYIAALTAATLLAEEITGRAALSGIPVAAAILGTATGAPALSEAMRRFGRRRGLAVAYALGASGAALAVGAALVGSFALLVAGMFVIGLGQSATALARYVAAELRPVERRASALSWIVWMGTLGAIGGPNLLGPAGGLAAGIGWPLLSGAYVAAVGLFGVGALLFAGMLRPDPTTLAWPETGAAGASVVPRSARTLLGERRVQVALATLVAGQVVMVLIMTMTPLHVHGAGYSLEAIGVVMSGHIVGMFVFAPLVGRLADRVGALPVILGGLSTLVLAAVLAAAAHTSERALVVTALFLLGLGWNLGYVAGSSLLTSGLGLAERARLQGLGDALVWSSAAAASLASSLVLAALGYPGLCLLGASLVMVPLAVIVSRRRPLLVAAGEG